MRPFTRRRRVVIAVAGSVAVSVAVEASGGWPHSTSGVLGVWAASFVLGVLLGLADSVWRSR